MFRIRKRLILLDAVEERLTELMNGQKKTMLTKHGKWHAEYLCENQRGSLIGSGSCEFAQCPAERRNYSGEMSWHQRRNSSPGLTCDQLLKLSLRHLSRGAVRTLANNEGGCHLPIIFMRRSHNRCVLDLLVTVQDLFDLKRRHAVVVNFNDFLNSSY